MSVAAVEHSPKSFRSQPVDDDSSSDEDDASNRPSRATTVSSSTTSAPIQSRPIPVQPIRRPRRDPESSDEEIEVFSGEGSNVRKPLPSARGAPSEENNSTSSENVTYDFSNVPQGTLSMASSTPTSSSTRPRSAERRESSSDEEGPVKTPTPSRPSTSAIPPSFPSPSSSTSRPSSAYKAKQKSELLSLMAKYGAAKPTGPVSNLEEFDDDIEG
mmetsp:Transcript_39670/g.64341  ORF Transcript_39670/g.64341 Transcript_39670/m.64341 type:complete len:215 (-) Transcript_39670:862-1506(-)|eukprot:CAMPEP_0184658164 /NCGR_PEP_ID=MMETSP0308-20130426/23875_1 /TAXON_ID=38269 /ORGANISM="Gloeochaete witrockiana, Strain SAG 46.84" /LENGTH=214 /DNA_ID=CAMNT_0027096865 /DNA_START=35 /DNA_END=679 /DNA_ORIENTATION=+